MTDSSYTTILIVNVYYLESGTVFNFQSIVEFHLISTTVAVNFKNCGAWERRLDVVLNLFWNQFTWHR